MNNVSLINKLIFDQYSFSFHFQEPDRHFEVHEMFRHPIYTAYSSTLYQTSTACFISEERLLAVLKSLKYTVDVVIIRDHSHYIQSAQSQPVSRVRSRVTVFDQETNSAVPKVIKLVCYQILFYTQGEFFTPCRC